MTFSLLDSISEYVAFRVCISIVCGCFLNHSMSVRICDKLLYIAVNRNISSKKRDIGPENQIGLRKNDILSK